MSRVGKLAWYWNTINALVLEQFKDISKIHWRIEKLEELSYDRYLEIAQFLGIQSRVTQQIFDIIKRSYPNKLPGVPTIASWNDAEIAEFEKEVAPMAKKLGYEYRVDRLSLPKPTLTPPEPITPSLMQPLAKKSSVKSLIVRLLRQLIS